MLVLVEGQTEETFIRDLLGPHLASRGVHLQPVLVSTKRVKSGLKFKGGINRYEPVRKDLRRLLADSSVAAVTTMIDYYGLPEDFPGVASIPRGASCHVRAEHLETALHADLGAPRLRPYLSLHEFEALLLVDLEEIGATLLDSRAAAQVADDVGLCPPEEINDGPETHPAARLRRHFPVFRKTVHGPLIAARIGLCPIRQKCPHFDRWLTWLESLG